MELFFINKSGKRELVGSANDFITLGHILQDDVNERGSDLTRYTRSWKEEDGSICLDFGLDHAYYAVNHWKFDE